ncbi:MAG: glycosyltransferase family 2 protein [Flavisolibacter sp.]
MFYNYAGYAIIIFLWNKIRKPKDTIAPDDYFPSISFIVAAYNEEDCIERKIMNSLQQVYPREKIEFIFITDGSTDSTPHIVQKHGSIKLLHAPGRNGKTAALNRAVQNAQGEILIFSDANTILNNDACFQIAKHYYNKSVGGVAGEKKVLATNDVNNATNSEGFYWKYESFLKRLDSEFHTVVGAAGELFSVRKILYEPVPSKVILDDFIISMKIAEQGFRIIYEPRAFAMELPSYSIQDESKRKVRISAGGFQSIVMLPEALFFWKHVKLSFLYISHRVLRWTLSPVCLVLALVSSFILAIFAGNELYQICFAAQILLYTSALCYQISPGLSKKVAFIKLCYYFTFMNVSVFQGFFKFIQNKQSAVWEKAKRGTNYTLSEIQNTNIS